MPLEHIKQTMDQFVRDALMALGVRPIPAAPSNEDIDDYFCEIGVQQMRFRVPPANFAERPWATDDHKTCRGCAHWHGVVYNNVRLVCGMHPSGIAGDCVDYEKRPLDEPVE